MQYIVQEMKGINFFPQGEGRSCGIGISLVPNFFFWCVWGGGGGTEAASLGILMTVNCRGSGSAENKAEADHQ